jgi:hypothetical protein
MFNVLRAGLFLVLCATALSGCGLLPTDRPPTGGFKVNYTPDPNQPWWDRVLFGTKWDAEGPAQ